MTELDRLPPDQRAVLSLVLDRGKSYSEVASMLAIPEATVRDRAHAALDAMARAGEPLASQRGAGGTSERAAARMSPASAGPPRTPAGAGNPRTRGALLLGAIVVVIVVVVILLTSGGKGSDANTNPNTTAASSTNTKSTSSTSAAKPRIDKKLTLSALEPESHAAGEAYVLSDGTRHAFYVAAHGLPPSQGFFYAVWLYNSPSSSAPLGRAPSVGSNGRLEGGGPLPSNASDYAKLIVTHETSTHARTPGTIVLSGSFSLH
ncbi:MAG: RNA polymerase sigma factor [Solirubrobacteraceae bacterium]